MKNNKQLGIFMDHSNAYLMELKTDTIITNCILSETLLQEDGNSNDVNQAHVDFNNVYKEKKQYKSDYYNKISNIILNFEQVILFGPADAKNELLNMLEADQLYNDIKIETKDADVMTENQMHALVKEYFKK